MAIRHNYAFLLAGLLLYLLGSAATVEFPALSTPLVLETSLATLFLLGVWTLVRTRAAFYAGCILGVTFVLLGLSFHLTSLPLLRHLTFICILVFLFLTCVIAIYDVLFGGRIDINRIIGSVCIYLLSGSIWGIVYTLLHTLSPGAFEGVSALEWNTLVHELTYLSFSTLTTLGYGDVTPVSAVARTLCFLESVLGQMYLTVLVAALVGVHIASRQPSAGLRNMAGSP